MLPTVRDESLDEKAIAVLAAAKQYRLDPEPACGSTVFGVRPTGWQPTGLRLALRNATAAIRCVRRCTATRFDTHHTDSPAAKALSGSGRGGRRRGGRSGVRRGRCGGAGQPTRFIGGRQRRHRGHRGRPRPDAGPRRPAVGLRRAGCSESPAQCGEAADQHGPGQRGGVRHRVEPRRFDPDEQPCGGRNEWRDSRPGFGQPIRRAAGPDVPRSAGARHAR